MKNFVNVIFTFYSFKIFGKTVLSSDHLLKNISIRRGPGEKKKYRGHEPVQVIIHAYTEMSQGNFL